MNPRVRELMTRIDTIAVTTDFSPGARASYRPAAHLARRLGARCFLLHVVEGSDPSPAVRGAGGGQRAVFHERLEREVRESAALRGAGAVPVLVSGDSVPAAVEEFASREGVDLLVSSKHTGARESRGFLGAFAETLLRHVNVSILWTIPGVPARAAAEGDFALRRVLVPLDLASTGAAAFAACRLLAERFGARPTFHHVVRARRFGPDWPDRALDRSVAQEELAAARGRLARFVERRFGRVEAAQLAVDYGKPYQEIVRLARAVRADLIAVTSHTAQGPHTPGGSVASWVLRHAPCPVLLVRPDRAEGEIESGAGAASHVPSPPGLS